MALDAMANATGRERMEHERIRLEGRLQQARRMETVGTFAAGIAHNVNNTLAAILGHAEIEETKAAARPERAHNIKAIRAAAERRRDFVGQILTFGRLRDALRQPTDVKALVDETASLVRATLPPNIELRTECSSDDVIVSGEATQLQQVIINLCNNAAQATTAPGQVILSPQTVNETQSVTLSHGQIRPGNYVRIAVSDTGCGMDTATISRIFDLFFTTRAAGNGLGLATVKEIVREHSGVVHVTSALGTGSRFEVWLPLGTASSSLSRASSLNGAFGEGERSLLLIRIAAICSATKRCLPRWGMSRSALAPKQQLSQHAKSRLGNLMLY